MFNRMNGEQILREINSLQQRIIEQENGGIRREDLRSRLQECEEALRVFVDKEAEAELARRREARKK